jgi:DNA-binding SARP family transcriptional activator
MPAPVTLRLFGEPEIEARGDPLALKSQKARALLFYLAVTGRPHTRNHLAALLWSEFPSNDARRSLRATLFQLRRALRAADLADAVAEQGDSLRLGPADTACDVADFRRLLAEASEPALSQAVALYRGPFLEGFSLPNAPLFDEWLRLEDQKLTQAYLGALRRLANAADSRRNWDQARQYLQRLVRADPLAEDAQQQLIGLYLKTGAISQALRQYHEFEAELQEKLGLSPAAETRALFQEALRRHQAPPAASRPAPPGPSRHSQPALPFVGRDGLLARLLAISREVRADHGSTVLLQGDGGIGKTRLLNEFLSRIAAETPPWLVLQGACSPFDDLISYGPFLDAFQDTALGDVTTMLLAPTTDAAAARDQFVYRILQMLRRLTQNAPLVLAVDDLQWANSSTLNLFGLLASRLHRLPLMLIGTVQRPEAIPALQRLITLKRRQGQLQLLPLAPLAKDAVADLLQGLAISPASIPSLADWLQERADGNPFILHEMVAQLRADAILIPVGDRWQLDPGPWLRWRAAYTLPETTHDLVSWRLRNLAADARSALELLAVAGQPLPFALLADALEFTAERLLPVVDDLLARRLLLEASAEVFGLPHHLLRETVLHRLSRVRRRMIHRRLAHTLAQQPGRQANVSPWEVARHAVAGEDAGLARRYGLALLAHLPHDYTGAATVDFLHHLYDLLAPSAAPDEMLLLTRVIGDVYQSLGHLPAAAHWREQYLELARAAGDAAAQATAYFEKGELALVSNDYEAATQAAQAGLISCGLLPPAEAALSGLAGRGHRLQGHALAMDGSDLAAAERHLQQATATLRPAGDPRDVCAGLFEQGNVAAQRGELLRALEFYEDAARVAEAGQVHYFHALARNNLAYHSLLLGWLKAAQRALAHGQKLAETYELLGALLHLSSTQGEIHLYLAEWDAAAQTFGRGLALAEELGNPERQAGYRAGLALAARGRHGHGQAISLLEEALLLISGRAYWHLRARLLIWLAETLAQAGRSAEAWPHLNAAIEIARRHGRALLLLQAERLRAGLLAAGGAWARAEACFNQAAARATALDLPLEIARTQAAWGQAALRFAPAPRQGYTLLGQAETVFADYQAAADLDALKTANPAITPEITIR